MYRVLTYLLVQRSHAERGKHQGCQAGTRVEEPAQSWWLSYLMVADPKGIGGFNPCTRPRGDVPSAKERAYVKIPNLHPALSSTRLPNPRDAGEPVGDLRIG